MKYSSMFGRSFTWFARRCHRVVSHSNWPKALAILFAIVGCGERVADAQTWLGGTSGDWSIGANWTGGVVPTEGTALSLTFGAAGAGGTNLNVDANNDANFIAAFILNRMTFTASPAGGNAGPPANYTISGATLQFSGAAPAIFARAGAANSLFDVTDRSPS